MNREVTITRQGIHIDGRPFILLAGQLHYFRYPKAEWRDLLLKARAGGLNTVDTVIPWNLHEPAEGQFDFDEEADLAAYLDLCAELGLYAIVRPGPYICAEWENGGFPAWLTAKPGLQLRVDDQLFLEHTLRWFDTLFPLLAGRQASAGGPIILCQIENEHWASGRYGHDLHQATLARAAIERGMHVPQYTCMGATRDWAEFRNGWSGIAEKLQQTRALWPENPMIVSELWSGWFDNWGASRHNHKTAARLDQILHQLTAVGASGWSHWMWAGGTNFGYWGGRTVGGDTIHMTTSYDYDAPVSEYVGLTEKFFVARRHHLFMSTLGAQLSAVLADAMAGGPKVIAPAAVAGRGEAGNAPYRNVRAAASAPPAWTDLTATFFQNTGLEGQAYQLFLQRPAVHLPIEVEAGAIKPIFSNLPLGETNDERRTTNDERADFVLRPSSLVLEYHTSRILGFWQHAETDVLVCYGSEGEIGQLQLRIENAEFKIENGASIENNLQCTIYNSQFHLRYWIADRPTVVRVRAGARALLLILLTTARAERWWPLGDAGYVCGPHLLLDSNTEGHNLELLLDARGIAPFYQISLDGTLRLLASAPRLSVSPDLPLSLSWATHAVAERYEGAGWQPIERPLALEELGCHLGYGWYRAEIEVESDEQLGLAAPWLSDRARLLLDGEDIGWLGVHPQGPHLALPVYLAAGRHDLRILADNLGRFNYGSNTGERKGLLDTLYCGGQQRDLTPGWVALWQEAVFAGEAIAGARPAAVRPDAEGVSLDNFAFQGPSVWLLREFEAQAGMSYLIQITGDRNPGALFVNGVAVARFSRHHGGGYIKADISQMVQPGANVLTLNIQGYAGAAWRATLLEYDRARPIEATWSFRPGVEAGDLRLEASQPSPASSLQPPASGMAFYRATFTYNAATHGAGPFKLHLLGMRKGQIWLNGRNLGRYWQIGPQECYKLPAAWLRADNDLVLFDEEGARPDGVWISTDGLGLDRIVAVTLAFAER
ncbi:MAG TPA: beta-galactosidase [Roseiflexaceae bacterium]|nr:beta-galactosidase [Roseiflexaceae bacterium]